MKKKDRKYFTLLFTTFFIGAVVGGGATYVFGFDPVINVDQPDANVNVSAPQVNNEFDPPQYNFIQGSNHEIDYKWEGRGIEVPTDKLIFLHGSSMRPTMFTGHTAIAKDYTGQELEEGDIIETSSFVHRIAADYTETSGYYLTRGDNNEAREKVKPDEIETVVIGVLYTDK